MTETEAKRLLLLRHPDGRDDSDPAISAALELARQKPALAQWARDEHRFNQRFASGLRSIQAPPDLLDTLLAQQPDRSPVSVSSSSRKRRSARHLARGCDCWLCGDCLLAADIARPRRLIFRRSSRFSPAGAIIGGQGELARFLSAPD